MTPQPNALELEDLVMHFGPVRAVDGVSLAIPKGRVTALVGESGSGKSTVGRCVVRLVEPTAGVVRIGGTDVTHLSRRQLRRHRSEVSIVFQDPAGSLDPRMLVGDVVAEPLRLSGERISRRDREARVATELGRVGLRAEVARRYPHELSGGQRQRVSIARALISEPTLLIADEPTSALDVSVQASVLNLLADLQRDIGFACLFITHDLSAVEYLADEIAVMYLGQLVETGSREQIFTRPAHPYTQALLAAAPVADPVRQRQRQPVLLGDDLPSALDPPSGCRFRTRCPLAFDRCATEVPAQVEVGGGKAACHLVQPDGTRPDVRTADNSEVLS
ncbi:MULTISPECIES: ABC transporter ATP-binding protein [Micromonospora]|uniref:Peptide ABC transporter ATP-binding protein n=1 Tax=Micromonospora sicca TaxID=2202420 RepID=A0A317DCM8_9ACTN|nr:MULTISPECIES: oligopeptide/dipeptide ABC transporter ATP-binding protein [unclassified Micromonospora]MBM0224993.1 ATP-binding cassette domain-containing protein [Micromonospora sp. ATA51]PWR12234.1 peptide ABC transporter ATP-binding protein [Micromonospora sp. 4G51]